MARLKIACIGGGPAGLYFAISMKLRNPGHQVTVIERNAPDDTFGWGVVLSDETLHNLIRNDSKSAAAISFLVASVSVAWRKAPVTSVPPPKECDKKSNKRSTPAASAVNTPVSMTSLVVEKATT